MPLAAVLTVGWPDEVVGSQESARVIHETCQHQAGDQEGAGGSCEADQDGHGQRPAHGRQQSSAQLPDQLQRHPHQRQRGAGGCVRLGRVVQLDDLDGCRGEHEDQAIGPAGGDGVGIGEDGVGEVVVGEGETQKLCVAGRSIEALVEAGRDRVDEPRARQRLLGPCDAVVRRGDRRPADDHDLVTGRQAVVEVRPVTLAPRRARRGWPARARRHSGCRG